MTTVYALQKFRATLVQTLYDDVDRIETPQVVSSTSSSAAIGTSATAILTLTNCVFRAGRAYSVKIVGGVLSDVAGRLADFALFKTSTAGTQYGAYYRKRCEGASQMSAMDELFLQRSAGTDLTCDLVLAVTASAGTVTHYAAASFPRALIVKDVGLATAWSFAFDVT